MLCHGASMQQVGQGDLAPLLDGTPLQGEQFPRFLRPTHGGEFGFEDLLVLGNHPVVQFEHRDLDEELGFSMETWEPYWDHRVGGVGWSACFVWSGRQSGFETP